ncbi:hypothetical protein [Nostoc sp. NMS9]|uniref:hypothetical protein n=1 Tax=Nostoc sp. NMS9 TaxID=2815393 RepID=UPI0025F862F6|nr:hypothetical protein [Nostoc sp. NMS9]MBN3940695.1 hypothetical protein [Nostoc sp. NMS9]
MVSQLSQACVYTVALTRGGLGWGKTLVSQLFQACVYTVASKERGIEVRLECIASKREAL